VETPTAAPRAEHEHKTIIVSTTREHGVQAIVRVTPRDLRMWTVVELPMSKSDMARCYAAQVNAVGSEYNAQVDWNMTLRLLLCTCLIPPSLGTSWYCSELIVYSLQGTACELHGLLPEQSNPEKTFDAIMAMLTARQAGIHGMCGRR
jgi:hypothetical protein